MPLCGSGCKGSAAFLLNGFKKAAELEINSALPLPLLIHYPHDQVAPNGARIPIEPLVLETGRRYAALPDCSADPNSCFEGGAALRQGM